jgi:hypothetical protein
MGFLARLARLRNQLEAQGVDPFKDVNAVVNVNVGGKQTPDPPPVADRSAADATEGGRHVG